VVGIKKNFGLVLTNGDIIHNSNNNRLKKADFSGLTI